MDWPADVRQSVIAHELGHVARRDAWSDLLIQLAWRACWFHPLLWLARQASTRLRERACDEWVLTSSSIQPRDYAIHLLEVVTRCNQPAHPLAPAMARGRELERRLLSIVTGQAAAWSRKPVARIVTIVSCLLLSGLVAAVHAVSDDYRSADKERETAPQTKLIRVAAEPVAANGPAITAGGVVVAPGGQPIPGATVILRIEDPYFYSMGVTNNRDTLAETRTDADGRFQFEKIGIPPRHERQINQLLANKGWSSADRLGRRPRPGLVRNQGIDGRTVPSPGANSRGEATGPLRDRADRLSKASKFPCKGSPRLQPKLTTFIAKDDLSLYTERFPEDVRPIKMVGSHSITFQKIAHAGSVSAPGLA